MRKQLTFHITNPSRFKDQLLFWSKKFEYVSILDSHEVNQKANSKAEYNTYELVAGVDALQIIEPKQDCFHHLKENIEKSNDCVGCLSCVEACAEGAIKERTQSRIDA